MEVRNHVEPRAGARKWVNGMNNQTEPVSSLEEDPLYRNCLREARFILGLWAVCCVYSVGYCYLFGYLSHEPAAESTGPSISEMIGPLTSFNRDPESLTYPLGLGIPDWVFYGILVPWVIAAVLTFWYVLFYFADDDLAPIGVDETNLEGES